MVSRRESGATFVPDHLFTASYTKVLSANTLGPNFSTQSLGLIVFLVFLFLNPTVNPP